MADNQETPMDVDQQQQDQILQQPPRDLPTYQEIIVPELEAPTETYDQSAGPRLMITHIVNENFKSYAGIQELGPFHKSFSSIVGPNGSGKSNVIDSMLFVFGYRANKIRSKKISVLVHKSEGKTNITTCTVTVHFQKIIDTGLGDDDYDVVPNSKFNVSRTANIDNSSYYCINGRRSTYKEVQVLLKANGIDLVHNRFLILQGEVEQIAMMKPKAQTEHDEGMLEYLEDIIGSSRYKEPLVTLNGRLEELSEIRVEKLNRVKAVEKEKDSLEGAKDEAIEFLTTENKITRKKHALFQKYIMECSHTLEKATKLRDDVKKTRVELDDKLKVSTEERQKKVKELKKIFKKSEELKEECEAKDAEFNKCDQDDARCRSDIKHCKEKGKKLIKTIESEKKKIEEFEQVPADCAKQVADLEVKLKKMDTEKEKEDKNLQKVMDELKTETQGLQEQKDKKQQILLDLQKNVNETRSKYNVAESELTIILSNQQSEEAKLREAEKNLDRATNIVEQRNGDLQEYNKKLPDLEKGLGKAKKDLANATEQERKFMEEVRSLRMKVEEGRSNLHSARNRNRVLDVLMQEKTSGKLPGILGRLGDLGAIDEKFDVAISTACGALDHIVVDTIQTAQACVNFMKKNNVGMATFIGLDKMARWKDHCRRKINTPESVPRLFDLVKVQNQDVLPAFYFALRDTLVAKDMEQATRIAYGRTRYRTVTLQGQVIDTSGTMSGGGNRVSRGRMGSNFVTEITPEELQEMEKKLEKSRISTQNFTANREQLEDMVKQFTSSHNTMKHTQHKCQMEIKACEERIVTLNEQVAEFTKSVKAAAPDPKKLKELEKNVASFKKEYDAASSKAEKVEAEVKNLHEQIMDIGGAKLQAVQSRITMIENHIDEVTGKITKAKVNEKTAARKKTAAENKVESLQDELKETEEQMEKLKADLKMYEEKGAQVMEAFKTAQENLTKHEETVQESRREIEELESSEEELKKEYIEVKHKEEVHENVVKENQNKVKHWTKEMNGLKLNTIDGKEPEPLKELSPEEAAELSEYDLTVLEEQLAKMKPNMAAIAEYRRKEEAYLKRVAELEQVTDMRDNQRQNFRDLTKRRMDEFMGGFTIITNKLKEMYQMITLGGDAELELVDSLDPFSEGIVFSVRPPKKSWKNISNLSGGEKTLSSLALVFALHHYKPTPLYVMDEIDAALDFKNVSIVANYIKERTKNAQFIIISLRNNMFELADRLIGIYKTFNCTKSVTINPSKISLPAVQLES